MLMMFAVGILWTLGLAGLFAAGLSDFRHRIIPNRLVVFTAGCGLALRLLADTPRSIGVSLAVATGVLLLLGLLAHQQIVGGGDAKLIAAVTLLAPPERVPGLLLLIVIGGAVLSALYLLAHLLFSRPVRRALEAGTGAAQPAAARMGVFRVEVLRIATHRTMPYGLATFAGAASYALAEAARWLYATS